MSVTYVSQPPHAVHDYLGIDLAQIWDIIEHDLPDLSRKIKTILKELGESV